MEKLTRYKCHKEVQAAKITSINVIRKGQVKLEFDGDGGEHFCDLAWVIQHGVSVGGYYVCYKNVYETYSPAELFEEGYSEITS
ncbi:MAG: hypothetical protein GY820_38705 [Gammaproteobacteria bacterium]|nr:hypothetical protein [Gammaproteobacteria bacterium]